MSIIKTRENLYKNVNENTFSFTFLCKISCICNFGIFVWIFMKFLRICRTKKLGMINMYIILGSFYLFFVGKGPIFGPKSGLGKSESPMGSQDILLVWSFQHSFASGFHLCVKNTHEITKISQTGSFNSFLARGNFFRLLITLASSLDPDRDRQTVGPDLDPNCLTL